MKIALVNDNDEIIGYEDKLIVHQKGLKHRAFSIVVFDNKNNILIHQRAKDKYHSADLWTNTCCSHLSEYENMETIIHSRLKEEMGFDCQLNFLKKFEYYIEFENGLIENEIDHLYVGYFNGIPNPSAEEVQNWKWINIDKLIIDMDNYPNNYTYWFKIIMKIIK